MENELNHIGTKRHSGRYPWGSGDDPQRSLNFLSKYQELKKNKMSEKEIADYFDLSINDLRARKTLEVTNKKTQNIEKAKTLYKKGWSKTAIAKELNTNESNIRNWVKQEMEDKAKILDSTKNVLKNAVDKKTYIDVGSGVEIGLGISKTKLNAALAALKEEGYNVHNVQIPQVGARPGRFTTIKVLTLPEIDRPTVGKNKDKISTIEDHSFDGGRTFLGLHYPKSISSNRIKINYKETGGEDKDGVIELRRNVPDLDLGTSKYAQVRIAVDDSHFLKGMAIYSDNIPKGYDIVFNTNKSKNVPKMNVLKEMKKKENSEEIDTDNPFGATIKANGQSFFINKKGEKEQSAINKLNEEGDWLSWSKALSSQVLGKQFPSLAKRQLDLKLAETKEEYDTIKKLTNPILKKKLLLEFADACDADAVHLEAAALPRQQSHVLLPITSLKENEIYARNYRDGEKVVLIRYPHGGIFEIPELKVNNKNPEAKKILGTAPDAVGINPKVAANLSGADFDGDTVLVIPNPKSIGIKTSPPLKQLIGFDPKEEYKAVPGMKKMGKKRTDKKDDGFLPGGRTDHEMGYISNLITDMTIKDATDAELARAVKHSMVVIDAEKHSLNYMKSYEVNGIAALKKRYQGGANKGASTLLSKAKGKQLVDERKDRYKIDPITGKKIYEYTNRQYIDKKGKIIKFKTESTKMSEVDDAFKLSSGTLIESVYAKYANDLKAIANAARKNNLKTKTIPYSPSARNIYKKEVDSLTSKLHIAQKAAPLERQANIFANKTIEIKKQENPNMEPERLKKIKGQALEEGRRRFNSKKTLIDISDKEWIAIQSGALTNNLLKEIFNNTNSDQLKQKAMPRESLKLSSSKIATAKAKLNSGFSMSEVADSLGVSVSLLQKSVL